MLKNEYLVAKIGVDSAENELFKNFKVLLYQGTVVLAMQQAPPAPAPAALG